MAKRIFDIIGAIILLTALSPFIVATAVVIFWTMGRPVLFFQRRPGRGGVPFTLVKFRTMRESVDALGASRPDGDRIMPIGRWLRAMSLDEVPELWNVLRGDMSLVGPRPLLMEYLPRYSAEQARRHDVRPGITGWAQINGRNALSWDEKFRLDVWYVDHWSFWLDLRILALTLPCLFRGYGISAPGEATMPRFQGSIPARAREPQT